MPDFNPSPHDRVTIGGLSYTVMPHPAVPTFAFGQEGRKAFVYQVSGGADSGLYALKKFKSAYRLAELVEICDELARFSSWPGLEVCNRHCLNDSRHADALGAFPDLEYAVLMPWIGGTTWYDMVIGMTPLSRQESTMFANAVAQVLAALEESNLAHCDISAANVIINPSTQHAHLIDVEDLYVPGFTAPAALPAGTDGYAHKTASQGLWSPEADRFAGGVIIAEMAAWHDSRIRKEAEDEHYFATDELQQDSPRYQLMTAVLADLDPRLPELFDRMWYSDTLAECPPLGAWQEVVSEAYHREQVAGVVSDWQPLTIPGAAAPEPEPAPPALEEDFEPAAVVDTLEESEPAPQAEPDEQPVPAQPVPAVVTQPEPDPAPPANIIQPPLTTPVPAPTTPPKFVQVQPTQQAGGPVLEWRSLNVPAAQTPVQTFEHGSRPIDIPAPVEETPEPEPLLEIVDDLPIEPEQEIQPDDPVEDVLEQEVDDFPAEDEPGEAEVIEPEPAADEVFIEEPVEDDEDPLDDDEDYPEIYADFEPDDDEDSLEFDDGSPEPAPEPEPEYEDVDFSLEEDDPAPIEYPDGLLKPILDLSHIDERNRPHLVWTESPSAVYYLLQEDAVADFSGAKEYKIKGQDGTRWSPPRLIWRRSGRLYYRVYAVNDDGIGPLSDIVAVRISDK